MGDDLTYEYARYIQNWKSADDSNYTAVDLAKKLLALRPELAPDVVEAGITMREPVTRRMKVETDDQSHDGAGLVEAGTRVKVPDNQTPLNDDLGHRYLDVIKEGGEARDNGTCSPYHGHSLEHCLHATGWVQRDLRIALDEARQALKENSSG